jgi:hypothetical protein
VIAAHLGALEQVTVLGAGTVGLGSQLIDSAVGGQADRQLGPEPIRRRPGLERHHRNCFRRPRGLRRSPLGGNLGGHRLQQPEREPRRAHHELLEVGALELGELAIPAGTGRGCP